MRRFVITAFALCLVGFASAQTDTTITTKTKTKQKYEARSGDHLMLQFGYTSWANQPDSIHTKGFPHTFNAYFMFDFPFKTNPHWSVALGPGIATDNIYFDKMYVGVKDNSQSIRFQNLSDTSHFKKYKLATAYLEAPVELRYRFNPNDDAKSVKLAIGAKIGTMLNAHVKGKTFQTSTGALLADYTLKESSKHFFNTTRLSLMARAGVGHFTVFGTYAATALFKEGQGPQVHPVTIGLTLSGL